MKNFSWHVSKIVGKASGSNWAQVHTFFPQNERQKHQFGNLIAAISLTAREEVVDIGSFGTEIISRLQEIYYSSEAKTVLKKLDEAFEKLTEEFNKRIELGFNLSVVLPKKETLVLYAISNKGRLAILRDGHFGVILKGDGEKRIISGFLKENDFLCLATEQFFELISYGVLKASMEGRSLQEIVESLAPMIHGRKTNSQTAAVLIKVKSNFSDQLADSLDKEEKPGKKRVILSLIVKNVSNFLTRIIEKLSLLIGKSRPSIYIRKEPTSFLRQKKTNFTIAIVMIGLLLVSIFFGLREGGKKKISSQGDWLGQIEYQLDQVDLFKESNPLKAKSILKEIEEVFKEKESQARNKKEVEKIDSFKQRMSQLEEQVRHQYKVENPEVFLDLALVKEGFKGSNISLSADRIVVLDKITGTVIDIDLKSKSSKIVIGSQDLQESGFLALSEENIFILKNRKIFVIDKEKGKIIQEKEINDLGKVIDLVGFSDNFYLLDGAKNRILKFTDSKKGLLPETNYLKGEEHDLSESLSLTIDGSVWVLFADGKVNKYTRGYKDAFLIMGLDEPFNQPTAVYTDENCDNLYILDRNNTRTVVISKVTGEYKGSYIWLGMAGAIDFVVSEEEGRMLFLTGQRIYEIGLKN